MSKRTFTKEQIWQLSQNSFVSKCSEKSVTYSSEFKLLAVKRYEEEGLTASQIFLEAGIDPEIVGKNVPNDRLSVWRRIVRTKGIDGLKESRGQDGGRPKTRGLSDADRIEYLETQIAYLKAENAFLAKLRAKHRE
jgi:transposase-like protein